MPNPAPVFEGKTDHRGWLSAIVDINGDRASDFILVNDDGTALEILVPSNKQVQTSSLTHYQTVVLERRGPISVIPADFNHDNFMDILLTYPHDGSSDGGSCDLVIYWGRQGDRWSRDQTYKSNLTLVNQPMLVDANADHVSDLYVQLVNGTRQFWLGQPNRRDAEWDFLYHDFVISPHSPWYGKPTEAAYTPHSNAIVAYNGAADSRLMVSTRHRNHPQKLVIENWKSLGDGLDKVETISLPDEYMDWHVGGAAYCDVNADGAIDILLPICKLEKSRCVESLIMAKVKGVWSVVFKADKPVGIGGSSWNFNYNARINGQLQPITLVVGDFDHDGKLDVITTMSDTKNGGGGDSYAAVLLAATCKTDWCRRAGTRYRLSTVVGAGGRSVVLVGLCDVNDDGSLDLVTSDVTTTDATSSSKHQKVVTRAYINKSNIDHCFINVIVLSQAKARPSGFFSPLPGATVICHITDSLGYPQVSIGSQLTQTSYNSLQSSYVDFGLGLLPNFIDSLNVSLPPPLLPSSSVQVEGFEVEGNSSYHIYSKQWPMLIPNSQIHVTPSPPHLPSEWTIGVLVTPSRYLMMTMMVFVAVIFVVALAITALHCLEMKSDQRDRILQKHHFHFDAM